MMPEGSRKCLFAPISTKVESLDLISEVTFHWKVWGVRECDLTRFTLAAVWKTVYEGQEWKLEEQLGGQCSNPGQRKIEGKRRRGRDDWLAPPTQWHGFKQGPGDGEGQGSLTCCRPRACRGRMRLNHNEGRDASGWVCGYRGDGKKLSDSRHILLVKPKGLVRGMHVGCRGIHADFKTRPKQRRVELPLTELTRLWVCVLLCGGQHCFLPGSSSLQGLLVTRAGQKRRGLTFVGRLIFTRPSLQWFIKHCLISSPQKTYQCCFFSH